MAKSKKKPRKNIAEARSKKNSVDVNPFDMKINRQKHEILGRKVSKHDKGMPGLSRTKAFQKVCIFFSKFALDHVDKKLWTSHW